MSAPAKPWAKLTSAEKNDRVKALVRAGRSYTEIATDVGAPSRSCVAGVANRLRKQGLLPPAASKQQTGAAGGTLTRVRARKKRERAERVPAETQRKPRAAHSAKPSEPIAVPPSPQSPSSLIDSFIAANGVRRFERGMSGDIDALRGYVSRHGYDIVFTQRGKTPYVIRGGKGRPKNLTRTGLFEFVDELRIADGLQPFIPRKEIAHGTRA